MREHGVSTIANLAAVIAECKNESAQLKKDMAASQKESSAQKQEILALRNDVNTLRNANTILKSQIDAQQEEYTASLNKKFADCKIPENAVRSKDADDDRDFDSDAEEQRSIDDREDFHNAQYDTLKERLEKEHDEIYMVISDVKQDIMTKLDMKFQKQLDVVAGCHGLVNTK